MPKTNFCKSHNPFATIRGAMVRAEVSSEKKLYEKAGINHDLWCRRKKSPEDLKLSEIRDIDDVLRFTEKELVELIRGR